MDRLGHLVRIAKLDFLGRMRRALCDEEHDIGQVLHKNIREGAVNPFSGKLLTTGLSCCSN